MVHAALAHADDDDFLTRHCALSHFTHCSIA
jgi:hypothetical protein